MQMFSVETRRAMEMIDITDRVSSALQVEGALSGMGLVFVPHTTAGITVNENADPSVVHDVLADLERLVPRSQRYYQHAEGNSAAHALSTLVGCHLTLPIEHGRLTLGTWQGIYFCEFDGPRKRSVYVTAVGQKRA
ncbi:MAG: secondary thiamine-phosphate synthase enzyme YjbQ [Candidatus Eisenbacteria bacterium]|nr:secondary thiamine-phosphate synthase enzyme YjbQ [Candidatus Eisenbacteria bacterium]